MERVYYNKLIRDLIPQKIKNNGEELKYYFMDDEEFEQELIKKVREEASGLTNAKTKEELMDEIADLLVVLEKIKEVKNISPEEMEGAMKQNLAKKGKLEKKIFLVWSSAGKYQTNEHRNP